MRATDDRRLMTDDEEPRIESKKRIQTFRDLNAWQAARRLVKYTYEVTGRYPKDQQFSLANQMQRAAVSVASNIAEGFNRDTMKNRVQFYVIAHGSLTELECQFILSNDLGYISEKIAAEAHSYFRKTEALLVGLIKASKERI